LPIVLRGLAAIPGVDVAGIVTVSDDGGSSGRLRRSFGMPAVGDLRNCLVALSGRDSKLRGLFQHRFSRGDVEGHSLGNLIVAALYQRTGSLNQALDIAGDLLLLNGRALASTEIAPTLCAKFSDGAVVRGESRIASARKRIERVWLEPEDPIPSPGVLETIRRADAVVLAPGSLYTSLLPNLCVAGMVAAIRESPAVKILICNLMTEPGETDGFSAADHLRAVASRLGRGVVEFCIVNSEPEPVLAQKYRRCGAEPVRADSRRIQSMGAASVEAKLAAVRGKKIRHHSEKLGRLIVALAQTKTGKHAASQAA
jgi:uncharacterized cofD-like protein